MAITKSQEPIEVMSHERTEARIYDNPPQVNIESPCGRMHVEVKGSVKDCVRFAEEVLGCSINS